MADAGKKRLETLRGPPAARGGSAAANSTTTATTTTTATAAAASVQAAAPKKMAVRFLFSRVLWWHLFSSSFSTRVCMQRLTSQPVFRPVVAVKTQDPYVYSPPLPLPSLKHHFAQPNYKPKLSGRTYTAFLTIYVCSCLHRGASSSSSAATAASDSHRRRERTDRFTDRARGRGGSRYDRGGAARGASSSWRSVRHHPTSTASIPSTVPAPEADAYAKAALEAQEASMRLAARPQYSEEGIFRSTILTPLDC